MSLVFNNTEIPYMTWNGNPTTGVFNSQMVWGDNRPKSDSLTLLWSGAAYSGVISGKFSDYNAIRIITNMGDVTDVQVPINGNAVMPTIAAINLPSDTYFISERASRINFSNDNTFSTVSGITMTMYPSKRRTGNALAAYIQPVEIWGIKYNE